MELFAPRVELHRLAGLGWDVMLEQQVNVSRSTYSRIPTLAPGLGRAVPLALALAVSACGGTTRSTPADAAGGADTVSEACGDVTDPALLATIRDSANLPAGAPLTAEAAARVQGLFLQDVASLAGIACLPELRDITITGTSTVTDLGPLADASHLRFLDISWTNIDDIAPLAHLPLESFTAHDSPLSDLSPFAGSKTLTRLLIYRSAVTSLEPLASVANLRELYLTNTAVRDLEPLAELTELGTLDIASTPVASVEPLSKLSLDGLDLSSTQIDDLSPIGAPAENGACLNALDLPLSRRSIADDIPRLEDLGWKVAWSSPGGAGGNPDACFNESDLRP